MDKKLLKAIKDLCCSGNLATDEKGMLHIIPSKVYAKQAGRHYKKVIDLLKKIDTQ